MRAGVLCALALLGACAFGSDQELFSVSDAAQPFADGARFTWVESGGERLDVVFRRDADGRYTIAPTSGEDPLPGVLFVPIASTPEEDYVAQLRFNTDNDGVVYAFLWRTAEGYRVVVDPGQLTPDDELSAADPYCTWQTYQGCGLSSREDAFGVYGALIYPRFVVGAQTPEGYIDLLRPGADAAPPRKGSK